MLGRYLHRGTRKTAFRLLLAKESVWTCADCQDTLKILMGTVAYLGFQLTRKFEDDSRIFRSPAVARWRKIVFFDNFIVNHRLATK